MIKELLRKEVGGKYSYGDHGARVMLYYPLGTSNPAYQIDVSGIGGYNERGGLAFIADFGSLDNNILAFALTHGKSAEEYSDKASKLRKEILEQENTRPVAKLISDLGVDKLVNDYLKNHNDISVETDSDYAAIYLNKGKYTGCVTRDKLNSRKYYLDMLDLISQITFVESMLKNNMIEISPDVLIRIIAYSVTGLTTNVKHR